MRLAPASSWSQISPTTSPPNLLVSLPPLRGPHLGEPILGHCDPNRLVDIHESGRRCHHQVLPACPVGGLERCRARRSLPSSTRFTQRSLPYGARKARPDTWLSEASAQAQGVAQILPLAIPAGCDLLPGRVAAEPTLCSPATCTSRQSSSGWARSTRPTDKHLFSPRRGQARQGGIRVSGEATRRECHAQHCAQGRRRAAKSPFRILGSGTGLPARPAWTPGPLPWSSRTPGESAATSGSHALASLRRTDARLPGFAVERRPVGKEPRHLAAWASTPVREAGRRLRARWWPQGRTCRWWRG